MTTITRRQQHEENSRRLMAHAKAQLAAGDPLQATEKAWGAFAHKVKAVSRQRGWPYRTHRHIDNIIYALSRESGDLELINDASVAHGLHTNYYEDWLSLTVIAANHVGVERAIAKLDAIAERYDAEPAYRRSADALNPRGRTPPRPPGSARFRPPARRRNGRNGSSANGGNPQPQ